MKTLEKVILFFLKVYLSLVAAGSVCVGYHVWKEWKAWKHE